MSLRSKVKKHTPWQLHYLYRKIYYFPQDSAAALGFLFHGTKSSTSFSQRLAIIRKFYWISYKVDCPHTEHELLTIARTILNLGPQVEGVIVEAGAYYGGSTAKLSLVAQLCGRQLAVFDSFEGMPENNEAGGKSIFGREHHFPKGSHAAPLDEVKRNVSIYGDISRCAFYKGFFSETMPHFHEKVAAACMNGDLLQSAKDCLRNLYPLMSRGGVIFSQDGHFPWIIGLLRDKKYWQDELKVAEPKMKGLGVSKFVAILPQK